MNHQTTTLSVFTFAPEERFWAFSQMAFARRYLLNVPGLQFRKLMGAGQGLGFTRDPDWSRYAFLGVWESEREARQFHLSSTFAKQYQQHARRFSTLYLRTIQVHGKWSGKTPFLLTSAAKNANGRIGILTRASIRPTRLKEFWEMVEPVSRELEGAEGLCASIGIGELPLIRQATFSIWESAEQMKAFAYNNGTHRRVIERTRQENWYSEDLFARFLITDAVGEFP
ncbi:MAG: hypothetical protein KDD67_00445 [Ignavibacteriae bacterium]|nr:hypothetical protein [Ignavibacteriota bacterium]MCB9214694.1 hypothetical protein [Ignavibacteria bacterium]